MRVRMRMSETADDPDTDPVEEADIDFDKAAIQCSKEMLESLAYERLKVLARWLRSAYRSGCDGTDFGIE